jgi:hypothetical protein
MATQQIHKSKRHANPMKTRNDRPKYKAYSVKQLEAVLNKEKPIGKKLAKIVKELNRKLLAWKK